MAPSITPASTHYALVIDAGSSGSRLQIYSWRDPDLERAEIVNEVRAAVPTIQATLSEQGHVTTDGRPWVESSKQAQGRAWWWPPFMPGGRGKGKGKGKEKVYDVGELERRALRRLVRVSKGVEGEDWVKRVEPGISTVSPADIPGYLAPLLSHALQHIPPSQHAHTPIYLYATAGMRLLPADQQKAILQSTCELVRRDYPFRVGHPTEDGPCGENIRIISGEEEGIWGWVAVNYLMDGFGHAPPYDGVASPESSLLPLAPLADAPASSSTDSVTPVDVQHHSPTFGFLDMGGASTQLAFSPSRSELALSGYPSDDLNRVALRLLSGEEVEWPVFVASWLGFGTNQARERYIETILDHWRASPSAGDTSAPLPDPCLPVNLVVPTSLDGLTPALSGTGNFGLCMKRLTPLLDHAHPCPAKHCLFGGQPTPHIDFSRADQRGFIGVSEYWYTAQQVLGLGGVWDWGEWEKGMDGFCAREWEGIEQQVEKDQAWDGSHIEKTRLQMQCFKGAWISNVLHEGIGIPRYIDSGGRDTLTGGEVGDTNAEAERRAREKGLLSQSQSQSNKYFQSMDEVDSTAISWTLGKMVIEASKAVPPRSRAMENAWRARLPSLGSLGLGMGGVGKAMEHLGVQALYAYAFFGVILCVVLYNWVKRRKRFALSSPRQRGRKPSVSDGPLSPAGASRWMSFASLDSDDEGASRPRATVGRVRLWSLRLANSVRRSLPFPANHRWGYDTLPRVGSASRPSSSLAGPTRSLRHASMPLHGMGQSALYSSSGNSGSGSGAEQSTGAGSSSAYPSRPSSPRLGGGGGGGSSYFPSSDGVALTVPIVRPGSTSPEPRRVAQSSGDLAGMGMGMGSSVLSPPRGMSMGMTYSRPMRARQNSNPVSGGGVSGAGWNDPPISMFGQGGVAAGAGAGVGVGGGGGNVPGPAGGTAAAAAAAGGGSGSGAGTGGAGVADRERERAQGVLTPSAGGISRQSSRVNLSEMGLKERSASRAGGGGG